MQFLDQKEQLAAPAGFLQNVVMKVGSVFHAGSGGVFLLLGLFDHVYDPLDVGAADGTGAVGGHALCQVHSTAAGTSSTIRRHENLFLLVGVEPGELDHSQISIREGNTRPHLRYPIDEQNQHPHHSDPRDQPLGLLHQPCPTLSSLQEAAVLVQLPGAAGTGLLLLGVSGLFQVAPILSHFLPVVISTRRKKKKGTDYPFT